MAPDYLTERLRQRFGQVAGRCAAMMPLADIDADLLAKYVLAEDAYLMATRRMQQAMAEDDPERAAKWAAVQERQLGQIMRIGVEFGLAPSARRKRGMVPR